MPSTASPRRPARSRARPELLVGPASSQLPPRPSLWLRDATVCAAGGIGAFGAAPLLARPGLAVPGLVAGVVAAAGRGLLGARSAARGRLADRLVEALTPGLGLRAPDRRAVGLRSWTGGWPGTPRRVELRYAPGVDDSDPGWRAELVAAVGRRLLADYEVAGHDRRRCRIRLRRVPPAVAAAVPAVQLRAERVMAELLGPTAAVTAVRWAGEELAGLEVRHEAGAKLAAAGYRHRVERVVSTMLPGRWRAGWDLEGDTAVFEVRPVLPQRVPHPKPVVTAENRWRIPLAVDEDGRLITWHLRGTGPHLICVGKTGLGKTVTMNGVVMEVALRGWPVWICDPKRIEFLGMRSWPNVQIVATTVAAQVAVVYRAWEEMERRYELIECGAADEDDFEPLFLLLDEYRDFLAAAAEWYSTVKVTGMPARCPVVERISSIVRKGRSARIHVILGTQRPDAEWLTGELRDNFGERISLGPLSPQGAMMMWEAPHIGVSLPRAVAGRATAVADDGRPVEVQAFWTPDPRRAARDGAEEDLRLLAGLRPPAVAHPPLQVAFDEELLTAPDEKGRSREWAAVLAARLVPADPAAAADHQPALERAAGRAVSATGAEFVGDNLDDDEVDVAGGGGLSDAAAVDLDAGYGEEEPLPAGELRPGDLVLAEDATDSWGVVESVEPDVTDEEMLCIDWRGDDDEAGSLLVPAEQILTARRGDVDDDPVEPVTTSGRRLRLISGAGRR